MRSQKVDLKQFREKHNLTKQQIMKIIERSISQINRIEQGYHTSKDVVFRLQQWRKENGQEQQ